jgi:hypothetical protein
VGDPRPRPFGGTGAGGDHPAWPPVPRAWPGATVGILAAGPSATVEQADTCRAAGARLIVVNCSYRLAPWADLLYACDAAWWQQYRPEFAGVMVTQDERVVSGADRIPRVVRVPSVNEKGLSWDPARIHQGANGGYQALNLAVLMGARRVLLMGYDMRVVDGKKHWHGDHPVNLNNPDASQLATFRAAFATTVSELARAGVEVFNCTPGSALDCFPRRDVAEALA